MGAAALVDAAAVVGSFQRMTRIADATGIPLDTPVNALSAQIQKDLGLRDFNSAASSATASAFVATVASFVRPLLFRLLGKIAKSAAP